MNFKVQSLSLTHPHLLSTRGEIFRPQPPCQEPYCQKHTAPQKQNLLHKQKQEDFCLTACNKQRCTGDESSPHLCHYVQDCILPWEAQKGQGDTGREPKLHRASIYPSLCQTFHYLKSCPDFGAQREAFKISQLLETAFKISENRMCL